MANYIIHDNNYSTSDGDIVTIDGVNYTVIDIDTPGAFGIVNREQVTGILQGDNVIIGGDVTGDIEFREPSNIGAVVNITLQNTSGTQNIVFLDAGFGGNFDWEPTITVPDGVDASGANIDASRTETPTLIIGEGSAFGNYLGGDQSDGADQITIGNNATIGEFITGAQDDQISIGTGVSASASILTGEGSDQVDIDLTSGSSALTIDMGTSGSNNDTLNVQHTPQQLSNLQAALLSDGYTSTANANEYDNASSSNTDFTFSGLTVTNNDLITVESAGSAPCFTRGVEIETIGGPMRVEHLQKGDLVRTLDNGFQPIRWIGSKTINSKNLDIHVKLRPIRIRKGALGDQLPTQDLLVSPQHRLMIRSKIAKRMFGSEEMLVPAKHLLGVKGIEICEVTTEVEYFHILFDQHDIVFSNGARTESLYPGPNALKALSIEALEELMILFPDISDEWKRLPTARKVLNGRHGRKLVFRSSKNGHNLFAKKAI